MEHSGAHCICYVLIFSLGANLECISMAQNDNVSLSLYEVCHTPGSQPAPESTVS